MFRPDVMRRSANTDEEKLITARCRWKVVWAAATTLEPVLQQFDNLRRHFRRIIYSASKLHISSYLRWNWTFHFSQIFSFFRLCSRRLPENKGTKNGKQKAKNLMLLEKEGKVLEGIQASQEFLDKNLLASKNNTRKASEAIRKQFARMLTA